MTQRTIKHVPAILLAAATVFASSAQAEGKPEFKPPAPPPVPNLAPRTLPPAAMAIPAARQGAQADGELECLLEPHLIANVGSPVDGTLAQVLVDRGAVVHKGQVVARLNSNVEEATVKLRRAQEEYGLRKVARNEELFRKQLISASDKDELETQTRLATLERKQQEEVLQQRTITSPLNGVVVERFLSPGDRVAQDKILKLAQIDPLNVEVFVPVGLFGQIKPGMVGKIKLMGNLGGNYKAKVTVVDRVIDAASGTFGVRLELPNPGNRIPAGLKCGVHFGT